MPTIKPGTYPSMSIQEGCRGPNDPALVNWDKTFGPHICSACKHFPGNSKKCKLRGWTVESTTEACVKHFERKD